MFKLFGRGKGPNLPKRDQDLSDDRVMDVVMQMSGMTLENMTAKKERRRLVGATATDDTLAAARLLS